MITRKQRMKRLEDAIKARDRMEVDIELRGLIFHGATVYEPRGISDAKLSIETLNECLDILRGASPRYQCTVDWLFNYLASQADAEGAQR